MKTKLVRKISKYLPRRVRFKWLRSNLRLPWYPDELFQIRLVETQEEFIEALGILHDCYVHNGYMAPEPEKIRLTPYHLIPNTVMAIALCDNRVIATMSLIRDSKLKLPADKIFDLSQLRKKSETLCEVSSLAIHPKFRGKGGPLLHSMIRFVWRYAHDYYKIDRFVISVNPKMRELYEAFYLFEPIPGKAVADQYEFVKGAPAICLSIALKNSYQKIKEAYDKFPIDRNLYQFMQMINLQQDRYPQREFYQVTHSFLNRRHLGQLISRFERTINDFSEEAQKSIAQEWGLSDLSEVTQSSNNRNRFQFSTVATHFDTKTTLSVNLKVVNVARGGLKIQCNDDLWKPEGPLKIGIKLGPSISTTGIAQIVWRDGNGNYGLKLNAIDSEWSRMIERLERKNLTTLDVA